jgi:diguanylate cyclase (GGDEF)-like protein/PAS domain S-box-containing protein
MGIKLSRNLKLRNRTNAARLLRRYGPALRVGGCFGAIFAATVTVGLEDSRNLVWVANGLLLSYLLLSPKWLWKRYFVAGFVAIFLGGLAVNPGLWPKCLALSVLNITEVAVAAFLLRRRSTQLPHFTDQRYLFRFGACAVLAAPTAAGIVFATTYWLWMRVSPWYPLLSWITTDGLGTAIVAPVCVSLFSSHLRQSERRRIYWCLPAALIPITLVSFCQERVPVIFLIYPTVGLILFRFGLGWASIGTLYVAAVGSWFTIHGVGPFARIGSAFSVAPTVLLQLYVASGMFLVLAAASVLDTLRATQRRLREIVSLHNLVTENSRDVIILADFDGNRSYVSASASTWGGWRREELLRIKTLSLVHPEDRSKTEAMIRSLRAGGDGGLLECRLRNKAGEFLWVEANLRLVRDPTTGAPIGILNMSRDITRRKTVELELKKANAALEELSLTDALTHVANRRRYDQCLSNEWRRGLRENRPLSLLLLDVDWFKSYNDTYGHPRGDSCLKQIAEAAQDVVFRPSDLVARIGGEEFAVILPNTPGAGAIEVAEQICSAVRHRKLPHNTNPLGCVTISIGCSTIVPSLGERPSTLMQLADKALYAAKHAGRNLVCSASLEDLHEASRKVS